MFREPQALTGPNLLAKIVTGLCGFPKLGLGSGSSNAANFKQSLILNEFLKSLHKVALVCFFQHLQEPGGEVVAKGPEQKVN